MARLLNFICEVLEYFGISSDLVFHQWQSKPYGQTRSIVRRIGSLLPLNHWPRVCFQLLEKLKAPDSCNYSFKPMVPSLADVSWIADDEGEIFTRFRNEVRPSKAEQVIGLRQEHRAPMMTLSYPKNGNNTSNENALNKISQLEDELSRLRSQIAMLITMQDERLGTPCTPVLAIPPPKLTSTPFGALSDPTGNALPPPPPPLPPPPPPPPPRPPMSAAENSAASASNLVGESQAMKSNPSHVTIKPKLTENLSNPFNMMDVLKDLRSVKLKGVARSPGGTPMGKKPAIKAPVSDPAALIANALKRKFSHRYMNDSSDYENEPFEFSPLSSPETSRFGQHDLKPKKPNIVRIDKIL
ncbi:mitochondrial fission regulator 2 isoform X2 [Stegostoma tigrinum]|uniref:mitochondrial fission regulator 2 isoform X2 n=1 Tax=Stegostoma tigrinum TaxID=3053191 RepID=UPI00202B6577|nr:mitochondrial fission regulator 2 isoform X2 [Stegostoma tigrinum]